MEEGNIPSPNFDAKPSGFLQFSSTPVDGKQFKPKLGKKNRMDNWKRFGENQREESGDSRSPGYGNSRDPSHSPGGGLGTPPPWSNGPSGGFGTPRGGFGTPRGGASYGSGPGGYNGSPRGGGGRGYGGYSPYPSYNSPRGNSRGNFGGGNFGTPRGHHRGGNFGTPHGHHRGGGRGGLNFGTPHSTPNRGGGGGGGEFRGGNNRNNSFRGGSDSNTNGYFHPSMIEDPWKQLEAQRSSRLNSTNSTGSHSSKPGLESTLNSSQEEERSADLVSDSMIPQVGDSLLLRNNALNDSEFSSPSQEDNLHDSSQLIA